MQYLQRSRLDWARRTLCDADPGWTTVRDVARRWGFSHMGRFSGAYVAAFGEYPHETLRRSGSAPSPRSGSPV